MMNGKIHFNSNEAACLFKNEITGQISDGAWENAKPLDHWKFWCNADVIVDGKSFTEGYPQKSNYNLHTLLKYTKEEMKNAVRFARSRFYRPELIDYARILTDPYYVEKGKSSTPFAEVKPQLIKFEDYPFTFEDKMKKVREIFSGKASEEFIEAAKAELLRVANLTEVQRAEAINAKNADVRKLFAKVGITEENFAAVQEEIRNIPVTDGELKAVLDSISKSIRNTVPYVTAMA